MIFLSITYQSKYMGMNKFNIGMKKPIYIKIKTPDPYY